MSPELESALGQWRKRWLACWVILGLVGVGFYFVGEAHWYRHLFSVLLFETLIAGWFLLIRNVQTKAVAQTSEGAAFRGPMPAWRAVFWACVAAAGVFWFGTNHSWHMAFIGAIFSGVFIGGFAFVLNWVSGERGRAWSLKHIGLVIAAYTIGLSVNALLKFLEIVFHKP